MAGRNENDPLRQMKYDIEKWVSESKSLTRPDRVYWCDGSNQEYDRLIETMLASGGLIPLNQKTYPGCYLHRSHPSDVARTEQLTFICSDKKEDAGPNNNWMAPAEAKAKMERLFDGSMKGRTMYVVPFLMGPVGSPYAKVGVEITDSPYVVASMHIMARVGGEATKLIEAGADFMPGLHSLGDLSPERRYIIHFPEENLVWSVGSGYGGNALLGKKCFALRLASCMARREGWMAEHMLIIGLEAPDGTVTYMAAAFPSASGKTNLAMMVSSLANEGYRVWTVGDDIAWMHIDGEGRLRAINPEAGFFGVAPGTSRATNPVAMDTMNRNSIFTNVALTPQGEPWWEGIGGPPPEGLIDWQGRAWTESMGKAAHPNSRFTAPARQCPTISKYWEDPEGVPISAIIFGSRRMALIPLVYQSFNWQHGVFMGSGMGAETTAAATGTVGVVRRDPMAMLPFCGYNMGDYFGHWLAMGKRMKDPPKVFRVNWFRKDQNGKFLWPGYGENIRVLKWILDRVNGKGDALESALGYLPVPNAIDTHGLNVSTETMKTLTSVDVPGWQNAHHGMEEFYLQFGSRMPREIWEEHRGLGERLAKS